MAEARAWLAIAALLIFGVPAAKAEENLPDRFTSAEMMEDLMYGRGTVGGPFTLTDQTGKKRSEIVIDDIREAVAFMRLTPSEGGWRVIIVDGAEDMNRNAANALLKVLEEPPPQAVLLLVCHAPEIGRAHV